jgi:glucose/arabinose dehydrogenase
MNTLLAMLVSILAGFMSLTWAADKERPVHLDRIQLPPGFTVSVYARVPDARSMTLSPSGIVYVGNRQEDAVYAVLPPGDRREPRVVRIIDGLRMPNGVAFRDGALYVAEVNRILKFPDIEKNLSGTRPVVINDTYPRDEDHGWKFIAFGPDGKLYVPVGAPCNICDPDDPIYSAITRLNADGTGREIFARGIRNTVGFTWHPTTRELWFTDNGRDNMGDDVPHDELNHAPRSGLHFGYPYFHGRGVPDPEYARGKKRQDYVEPVQELGAHVAALGMRFYTGNMFPPEYRGRAFIALHGSWNRSRKSGYSVMMVTLDGNKATAYESFATGWTKNEVAWGRPVDVLQMPDGALLVSGDFEGALYRIAYTGSARPDRRRTAPTAK